MNWVLYFVLLLEVAYIGSFERKIWGTYLTPFCFLFVPYTVILFFLLIFAHSFGFFEIYWKSIFVWNVGAFLFWLPSLFFGIFGFKRTGRVKEPFIDTSISVSNIGLIKLLTVISLVLVYYKIFILSRLYPIGSLQFETAITHGFDAHLSILLRLFLIYYVVIVTRKTNLIWVLILLIIGSVVIYGSKSWILIPLIAGLIIRNIINKPNKKIKIRFRHIVLLSLFVFLLFFVVYYFSTGKNLSIYYYTIFLIEHIIFYFSAGIISFSEYLRNIGTTSIDPLLIIGTPINVFNKIMGYEVKSMVSDLWVVVNDRGSTSNVKTALGTLYIYAGWFYGALYLIIFSSIHYCLLFYSIYRKNIFLLIVYFFWSSMLFFGWFELYYHLVAYYEVPLWGFFAYTISRLRLPRQMNLKHAS